SPVYGGGALEAYSYATYGSGWLPDEDGHEPAHTWWGGVIPNSYLRSLWNESFAEWSEGLFRREVAFGNRDERRLAFVTDAQPSPAYAAAPLAESGAAIGPVASALGYGKGAKVLQILELELGTDLMIETCRDWIRTHPVGENADWEDYEKAVSRVAKQPMTWFFDQWVRRPGWLDFSMEGVSWSGGKVVANPLFKGQPYRFTCEVMLQDSDGKRSFQRVVVEPGKQVSIPASRRPALVSFDPWRRLLRRYEKDETPVQLGELLGDMRRYTDSAAASWLPGVATEKPLSSLPSDLNNVFIVGSPERVKAMAPLCRKAGFTVKGDKLTYAGTTIDLNQGCALAVVDLGGGKRCAIGLGKTLLEPKLGRARTVVTDPYGRFLRGKTEPKTTGFLSFRL
ncbi:MAG TPA: M1 family aminopeptidase, partial [Fimbriimonadaceae bacterium]|nr:M1 family aminopeptidase [Fimbriimonadaceae bacterium]